MTQAEIDAILAGRGERPIYKDGDYHCSVCGEMWNGKETRDAAAGLDGCMTAREAAKFFLGDGCPACRFGTKKSFLFDPALAPLDEDKAEDNKGDHNFSDVYMVAFWSEWCKDSHCMLITATSKNEARRKAQLIAWEHNVKHTEEDSEHWSIRWITPLTRENLITDDDILARVTEALEEGFA